MLHSSMADSRLVTLFRIVEFEWNIVVRFVVPLKVIIIIFVQYVFVLIGLVFEFVCMHQVYSLHVLGCSSLSIHYPHIHTPSISQSIGFLFHKVYITVLFLFYILLYC